MRCEEIQLNLEQFIMNELSDVEMNYIKEHLDGCCNCKKIHEEINEQIFRLKNYKEEVITMPKELETQIINSIRTRKVKKINVMRYLLAASIVVVILAATVFAGAISGIFDDLSFVRKYFTFGDEGLIHSLEKGVGQNIEQSMEDQGINVTVHKLIADTNRTVMLFSINAADDFTFGRISTFKMTDRNGVEYDQNGSYLPVEGENTITGNIKTVGIDEIGDKVTIRFDDIYLYQNREAQAILNYSGDENELNQVVDLGSDYGKLIIKSVVKEDGYLFIKIKPEITDVYGAIPLLRFKQGEDELFPGMTYGNNEYTEYKYELKDGSLNQFTMEFEYKKTVAYTEKEFIFNIDVDKNLAKASTYEEEINQSISLEEGITLKFGKLVSTASQNLIEYNIVVDDSNKQLAINNDIDIDIEVYNKNGIIHINKVFENGQYSLRFDPTETLEDLSITVNGYYKRYNEQKEVTIKNNDVGKLIKIGDAQLIIDSIQKDNEIVTIKFTSENPYIKINSADVMNGDVIFVNNYESDRSAFINNIISFTSDSEDSWKIVFTMYEIFKSKVVEVRL